MSARVTVFAGLLAAFALPAFPEDPKLEEEQKADVVEEGESKPITEEDIDRYLKAQGYTPVEIKGVMHYCRKEAPFGTRVKKSVCITGERAKELRTAAKEEMRRIDQRMWKDES